MWWDGGVWEGTLGRGGRDCGFCSADLGEKLNEMLACEDCGGVGIGDVVVVVGVGEAVAAGCCERWTVEDGEGVVEVCFKRGELWKNNIPRVVKGRRRGVGASRWWWWWWWLWW